ncbi:hypothetical protein KY289_006362 [Solanum tuberosum]|nr:hypothetical protein KY289_006362 [Solanum tuberosum]
MATIGRQSGVCNGCVGGARPRLLPCLARSGCRVVAGARRGDRLKSLCDEINTMASSNSHLVRAMAIELDVTADGTTIEASIKKAWDAFGHIDALINNAGVRGGIKSSVDISEEEWENTLRTNLTGSCSSKAAMDSMTKIMALELGEHNIRVNAIAPGLFKSEITENLVKKEWLKNVAKRSIPLKTFGTTDPALTSLLRYLVHDSSNYVSGNIFIVDAGYTLPGVPIFSSL